MRPGRIWAGLLVSSLGLGLGLGATKGDKNLTETIKRDYCAVLDDDPGGEVRRARVEAAKALGEPGRSALLELADSDSHGGRCARHLLEELGDARLVPIIRRAASDPRRSVLDRADALGGLGVCRDRQSLPLMLDFLNSGEDAFIMVAVAALARVDDDAARHALRRAVADPAFSKYASWIVRSIGAQRDPEAVEPLLSVLAGGAHDSRRSADRLRSDIAFALVRIGLQDALMNVIDVLEKIRDEEVRSDSYRDLLALLRQERAAKSPSEAEQLEVVIRKVEALQAAGASDLL